jgi:DNA polymerase III subunit alpha
MSERVKLRPSDFVHLHNHTQYSLLDGLTKVPALMDRVRGLGMKAIAVTDHGTMSGAIEFYNEARTKNIKPIIGMEAYLAARRYDQKEIDKDRPNYHLTLLAMNNTGYKNLMRLASVANLEGFYYKPRIDKELLQHHHEGLIILSGCIGGEIGELLRQGQYEAAKKVALWYQELVGDRFYIEIQDHGHPEHPTSWQEQQKVNQDLLKIAEELDIPAVLTCDAHYLHKEDQEAHEVLLCVQTSAFLTDEQRFSLKEFELHLADPEDVINRWGRSHPDLILNSAKIAERCEIEIELGNILIPTFPTPKAETEKDFLELIVWQGLAWRYKDVPRQELSKITIKQARAILPKAVVERAEFELNVVNRMGFNGYFLIVQDFINWGKDRGIVFGPGRGSAASSILAYALRITEIDPLEYDLLFERFLNPDRISMPDMDIDIQDSRRDEVIAYCIEKYGSERVANIVTFGRMAARNSVRDVARVLQVPYAEADRLAKMIPPPIQGRHTPLSKSLTEIPELAQEYATNQQSARVFELAMKLEGTIRSHGVHAAGVVIAPDELINFTPLEMAQKGVVATQYSMGPVEELGLLKMDFLGLSNLTIIKNSLRIIKKVYGHDIDIGKIPLDDKKTFRLLQKGETTGVFQLESAGMRRYLKQLKPTVFEDIIAMVALYRPGPMQWIEDFIARKNGQKKIEYTHPVMKNALENTYGIIVYQEQVMQISKDLCGFSGGQADTLRKGIAKKIPEVLAKMKKEFIDGAVSHSGADRRTMEKFWAQLEDFAAYCFNKVHSACYGLIAYQTAYLKANYPDAYMAALMTSDYDNIDRLAVEIAECKHLGIKVLPPDINQSFHEFAVIPSKNEIRFGLDAIKNVGHGAVDEILRARQAAGGKIKDLESFAKHANCRIVNRKALESLIRAGSFDSFGNRGVILANLDHLLAFASQHQKSAASGQVDLFGNSLDAPVSKLELKDSVGATDVSQQLIWERELLGLYLSHHPLEDYETYLSEQVTPVDKLTPQMDGHSARIGGSIHDIREITTKNGGKMAFVKLADMVGELEIVVFPKVYEQTKDIWQRDKVVVAKGKLDYSRDGVKLIADEVKAIDKKSATGYQATGKVTRPMSRSAALFDETEPVKKQPSEGLIHKIYIRMEDSSDQPLLLRLKEKIDGFKGSNEIVLVTGPKSNKQAIRLPQRIDISEESIRELAKLFGSTNVIVR